MNTRKKAPFVVFVIARLLSGGVNMLLEIRTRGVRA